MRPPNGKLFYMNALKMELFELVERLPEDQIAGALDYHQRLAQPVPDQREKKRVPFSWVGMIKDGPSNASDPDYIDSVLAQGFGRQ